MRELNLSMLETMLSLSIMILSAYQKYVWRAVQQIWHTRNDGANGSEKNHCETNQSVAQKQHALGTHAHDARTNTHTQVASCVDHNGHVYVIANSFENYSLAESARVCGGLRRRRGSSVLLEGFLV